jgi:hypothetical protein
MGGGVTGKVATGSRRLVHGSPTRRAAAVNKEIDSAAKFVGKAVEEIAMTRAESTRFPIQRRELA